MTNESIHQNAREVGDNAAATLQEAGQRLSDKVDCARESAKKLQGKAKDYVTRKPLQALGVTLGVGLLLGLALGRR